MIFCFRELAGLAFAQREATSCSFQDTFSYSFDRSKRRFGNNRVLMEISHSASWG